MNEFSIEEEHLEQEEPKKEEKLKIEFNENYYDYKVAIMEDDSVIYCDIVNGTYISLENNPELWTELQAMNFVSRVYKLNKDSKQFILPEDLYIDILSSYVNDTKISMEYLDKIYNLDEFSESDKNKLYELYPYFCAYVIGKNNSLSEESILGIADKIKKMLNNEDVSFQNQENTMVLNMPKNNEIIDKFLNRLNQ